MHVWVLKSQKMHHLRGNHIERFYTAICIRLIESLYESYGSYSSFQNYLVPATLQDSSHFTTTPVAAN